MPTDEQKKENLLNLIRQVVAKGRDIVNSGGELVGFGQRVEDLGLASADVLEYVPPGAINIEPMIRSWKNILQQEDEVLRKISSIPMSSTGTSGYAANYFMTELANPSKIINLVPLDKQSAALEAADKLSKITDSQTNKDEVISLFNKYNLINTTSGRSSPSTLLETSYATFEKPTTMNISALTSLVPMRECINTIVAELLQRRPEQQPAKPNRDKILSICHQCASSAVNEEAIQSLATRFDKLIGELSGSKNRQYSRSEWRELLQRAALFLIELLKSLDTSKMK